jgi:cytochrome oxidase Cu insertion factor (SCO1/SenC/PrrC family)
VKKLIKVSSILFFLAIVSLLASCGTSGNSENTNTNSNEMPITLKNQDGQDVRVPLDNKSTVIFFFTTHT